MKNLKGILLGAFLLVSFSSFASDTLIIEDNASVTDVAAALDSIFSDVQVIISDEDFPPKDTQGWVLLIFAALPFISKILVSGTRVIGMFKDIFSGTKTTSIVFGVGMALAAGYEVFLNGYNFDFIAWGSYSSIIVGASMLVHEIYTKLTKKDAPVA